MSEDAIDAGRQAPRYTKERLLAALDKVPRFQRAIYWAAAVDGLSYAEISRQTGLSITGVEKTLAKALVKLSRALDEGGEGG